jgi:hypothetical protein
MQTFVEQKHLFLLSFYRKGAKQSKYLLFRLIFSCLNASIHSMILKEKIKNGDKNANHIQTSQIAGERSLAYSFF